MTTIRVNVTALGMDEGDKGPYMLLQDEDNKYALPIYIGLWEANAIAVAFEEQGTLRPICHDLLAKVVVGLEGRLDHVVVTHIDEGVYYALLVIDRDETILRVDSRPSDAVAVALRLDAPIFVEESLLAEGSLSDAERNAAERKRWKEFLEGLSEDDFGKYET